LRYQILIKLASIPVALFSLWQAFRYKDALCYWQRFGYRLEKQQGKQPLWLHAASVGEVSAAIPLILAIMEKHPSLPIVITTFTPTGKQIAQQRLPDSVQHVYLPIDSNRPLKRFYKTLNPQCGIIMETELWPNLFKMANTLDIPLIIINGRLSKRTLNTKPWIKKLYQTTLSYPRAILARSSQDKKHYIALGASPETTREIGNIKYGALQSLQTDTPQRLIQRPYVLVASTHNNEEKRIANVWKSLNTGKLLLVIVPRHPYRTAKIMEQLRQLSDKISVRSNNDSVDENTEIYLADTVGELMAFMAFAKFVVMGGSLVPVGGHNILEPAMLGKAIIFGPHMENFAEECQQFLATQAALQFNNDIELKNTLTYLLSSPDSVTELGGNVKKLVVQNTDILERYISAIEEYCPIS